VETHIFIFLGLILNAVANSPGTSV